MSRGPPTVSTAPARRRSRPCCTVRRWPGAYRGGAASRPHQRARLAGHHPGRNLDAGVWTRLATGSRFALPDNGLGVLNHVHADDVAQAFERALAHPAADRRKLPRGGRAGDDLSRARSGGRRMVRPRGRARPRRVGRVERRVGSEHAAATRDHIDRSIAASIDRARSILGYRLRYSSLEALRESLRWPSNTVKRTWPDRRSAKLRSLRRAAVMPVYLRSAARQIGGVNGR